MPRRLARPSAGLLLALAAAVLALPACDKKKPTQPDVTPDGNPNTDPVPNTSPDSGAPAVNRPVLAGGPLAQQSRTASKNNLIQIALAFHNFHDQMNGFPAGVADKDGKVGLSWRVALLPFIEQHALYGQFKLDEPWDSPHNKKLIPQMPKTYAPPNTPTNGYTFYRSFSGPGTVIQPQRGRPVRPGQPVLGAGLSGITDGTSNTFLVAEAYDPVIWTKPDDLPVAPGKPPKLGGGVFGDGFHAAFCDGSVRFFRTGSIDPTNLERAIQIADGTIVDLP